MTIADAILELAASFLGGAGIALALAVPVGLTVLILHLGSQAVAARIAARPAGNPPRSAAKPAVPKQPMRPIDPRSKSGAGDEVPF